MRRRYDRGLGLKRVLSAACALAFMACAVPGAVAETRIALVLGNSAYAARPLANPRNDAELMARTLKETGFDVATVVDADQAAMKRAILDFGRRLRASDSVGVFYYAGHGVQVDGENYLIPVGADIRDAEEVALSGINLTEILKTMERAASRLNVAILDACRDNPFPSSSRSGARGLAPVSAPSGTLIAYATAPGAVALDGSGDNSPYSAALAQEMRSEGLALEEVFRRARRMVLAVTNGRQTPWEHSSLTGEFFFKPKIARPETSARDEVPDTPENAARLAELAAWEKIRKGRDGAALRRHLDIYPDGLFAELAKIKLDAIAAGQPAVQPSPAAWNWTITTGSIDQVSVASVRSVESDFARAVALDSPTASPAQLREAAILYRQAAENGLAAAMHALGRLYQQGRGVEKDRGQALTWYRRAAEHDHAGALGALGTIYEFGDGVGHDLAEALRLYRLGAERGDVHAMTSLAYLYAEAKGVARNVGEARRLYQQAAEKGHPRAMFNLALLHMRGGTRDMAQAVQWLQSAADKGHTAAMRELAVLYDEGRGVARSSERAAALLMSAYAAGDAQARADIGRSPQIWSFATRRQVQKALTARGLYSGRATGVFDSRTRQALARLPASK